jgi:hypothetical protein
MEKKYQGWSKVTQPTSIIWHANEHPLQHFSSGWNITHKTCWHDAALHFMFLQTHWSCFVTFLFLQYVRNIAEFTSKNLCKKNLVGYSVIMKDTCLKIVYIWNSSLIIVIGMLAVIYDASCSKNNKAHEITASWKYLCIFHFHKDQWITYVLMGNCTSNLAFTEYRGALWMIY